MWSLDEQHQHHLGDVLAHFHKFSEPSLDLLNQKHLEWGYAILVLATLDNSETAKV
jgi:hypothetical protein